MPANKTSRYLLAYDIADPRRLREVHRTVRQYGMPLQYSVFIVPGTAADIDALVAILESIIEPSQDDIRIYPVPTRPDLVQYGRQWLADGVHLLHGGPLQLFLEPLADSDPTD